MKTFHAIVPLLALAAAGGGAFCATTGPRVLEVLPTVVSERLAQGARWDRVERPYDRWRCTSTEEECSHGGTARITDCSQRVGVFALRWHGRETTTETEGSNVYAGPDHGVQRVVPSRLAVNAGDCPIFAPHGDVRDGGVLQHARCRRGG